jgi:hypothetical protein
VTPSQRDPHPGKKASSQWAVKITEAKCSAEVSYEWGTI